MKTLYKEFCQFYDMCCECDDCCECEEECCQQLPLQVVEGVNPVNKDADQSKDEQVLVCESRCDSEDTHCPELCELVEQLSIEN